MSDDLAAKREIRELQKNEVTVMFQTTVDLIADELTDQDWIDLGKFVAKVAAMKREQNASS